MSIIFQVNHKILLPSVPVGQIETLLIFHLALRLQLTKQVLLDLLDVFLKTYYQLGKQAAHNEGV